MPKEAEENSFVLFYLVGIEVNQQSVAGKKGSLQNLIMLAH